MSRVFEFKDRSLESSSFFFEFLKLWSIGFDNKRNNPLTRINQFSKRSKLFHEYFLLFRLKWTHIDLN